MDDHGDHAVFDGVRVGAVCIWSSVVEADHRILHAVAAFYGNGGWVGIVKGMGGVRLQRVGDYAGRVLLPEGVAFLAIVRHGHYIFSTLLYSHGIPDEFTGRGPSKVTHVFCLEYPGFLAGGFFLF